MKITLINIYGTIQCNLLFINLIDWPVVYYLIDVCHNSFNLFVLLLILIGATNVVVFK